MYFEWDSNKNKINIKKHHVDFADVKYVFYDPNRIDFLDEKHSTETEERRITIGQIGGIFYVVYTERKDAIRLISARTATKKEKDLYYESALSI